MNQHEVIQQIEQKWSQATIRPGYVSQVREAAENVKSFKVRYQQVALVFRMPWYIVGVIHMRESGFDFQTHLANGDPLYSIDGKPIKTTHEPRGMGPFFSWEEGAVAALEHEGWDHNYHWDIANAIDNLERYNGLGYRYMNVSDPYTWSMTNEYSHGKYSSDGVYDEDAIDRQVGCAAVLLELQNMGEKIL